MAYAVPFDLAVFLVGTFAAALLTGLAGFAFGLIAAAIWLHVLTPLQTTSLIVAYALLVQAYAVWKLRGSISYSRLLPFVLGSALGIPLGVALLEWASPSHLRIGVGVLLILFSVYSLVRPPLPQFSGAGWAGDTGVGVVNGVLGGATALAGIILVIWSGLRGWSKEEQRSVFQPAGVASFLMIAIWLGGSGRISPDIIRLFAFGLPALLVGTWLGWWLYGRLDEAAFRKVVLVLLLISGAVLALPPR